MRLGALCIYVECLYTQLQANSECTWELKYIILSIKMANVYVSGAVAITTDVLSNRRMQARNFN